MRKERVVRTLGYLTAVACWLFLPAIAAQAATFIVNSPSDMKGAAPLHDGICATAYHPVTKEPNGVCTLRAAIQEANALFGGDQIVLPPNTYLLTLPSLFDEVVIAENLTISGSGASTTIIDGNGNLRPDSGVLSIDLAVTVSISGVTIRNGGRPASVGGGIQNDGILTLTNSTVSGNSAVGGGGIFNFGTLVLTNSTVSANNASQTGGGGISNVGTLVLTNSTVSGNNSGLDGGGIYNGRIGIFQRGIVTLINSTVSANDAGGNGGGIYVDSGTVNSFNSTITQNLAGFPDFTGAGGGVFVNGVDGGTFNFLNTILAGNFVSASGFPFISLSDCAGTINSNGNNLMRTAAGCTVTGLGVTSGAPQLGPLQNNGGPTQTHALLPGSPAIDAGNSSGCRDNLGALLATDQRGFFRTADGNQDGNARCDIGAYEANAVIGNEAFVFKQYVDFLDREPDAGGLAAWVNALNGGYPRASLIEAFMDSGEFRFKGKFIAQTYLGILTRDADVGGFEAWLGALLAGVSREQIVQGFLGSGEFQSSFGSNLTNAQFVERMYNNILLRSSDPGGFNFWVGILDSGQLTRAQLALIFLDSGEFQSLSVSQNRVDISLLYFDMLQRGPDAGGFSWWVGVLNAGVPLTSVIDAFLNSAEYKARF